MLRFLKWRVFRVAAAIFLLGGLSLLLVPTSFSQFFSANQFLPHATCYLRNQQLIWLHVSSDMIIGLSYVAISGTLAYLVHRARREIPFHWMFLAFGLFIVTCGFTHFMEVWTVWQPVYWLAGYVKVVTAIASLSTAILLPPLVPKINALITAARISQQNKDALERTNRELGAANEELKAFTYSASHDLRAPLRTMSSMSGLLLDALPPGDSSDARTFAERIQRGAKRMNTLLDDLLTYSAFYKMETPVALIAVEPVLQDVLGELESDLKLRKANVQIAGDLLKVMGNPSLLRLTLANLIGNAAKYVPTDRSPEIRIEAVARDSVVEIAVVDNGYGVPDQYRARIFEPFERLHRAEEHEGTGLGLAIVTRAVQKMHGEVGLDSEVGKGSRFWVRLPQA